MDFGSKIKAARQDNGFTQKEIAEKLHVREKQSPVGKPVAVIRTLEP